MNQRVRGGVSIPGARPGATLSGEGIAGSLEYGIVSASGRDLDAP